MNCPHCDCKKKVLKRTIAGDDIVVFDCMTQADKTGRILSVGYKCLEWQNAVVKGDRDRWKAEAEKVKTKLDKIMPSWETQRASIKALIRENDELKARFEQ